jgi:hypothetical protein
LFKACDADGEDVEGTGDEFRKFRMGGLPIGGRPDKKVAEQSGRYSIILTRTLTMTNL